MSITQKEELQILKDSLPKAKMPQYLDDVEYGKCKELLDDLGWEYDRMTSSGQETLDKLYKIFGMMTNTEADWLINKVTDL